MKIQEKNWILMTGCSRGIGRSLALELQERGFLVCGLIRPGNLEKAKHHLGQVLDWDLGLPWEANPSTALRDFVLKNRVVGFIHAAGLLGPMTQTPEPEKSEEWRSWWAEYFSTLRVNHTAAVEIMHAVQAQLKNWECELGERSPFIMHLSSGAAVKPYAGWDAYCSSKAAMLMEFKCLAARISSEQTTILSVAPGTVMTDMMQKVLSANPSEFPALPKFKALEQSGGLLPPEVPAKQICDWLIASSQQEIKQWHGELYDVRSSNSLTK
jgi:NAD(P)-dependent dehydrogenase (short-subunit alcohol dehydrogenase family)